LCHDVGIVALSRNRYLVMAPQLRPWQELLPYRRCAPAAEIFAFPTEWGEKNAKWGFSPFYFFILLFILERGYPRDGAANRLDPAPLVGAVKQAGQLT
jgi:hypothetical protein